MLRGGVVGEVSEYGSDLIGKADGDGPLLGEAVSRLGDSESTLGGLTGGTGQHLIECRYVVN